MATAIEDLLLQLKKVDELCAPSQASANNYQALLKELYDGASETCRRRIGPLNKLTIAALDDESIWEQLQTRNIPLLRIVDKMSKRLKARIAVKKPAVIPTCDESASDDEQSDKSERIGDAGSISGEESGDKSGSEGDFDESREDYEEMSQGSSVEDNSAATTDLNEDDRMEAWLDREDELEIDRQYRAEKRGVAPEEVGVMSNNILK